MKRIVNKSALVRIIARHTDLYSREEISEIIANEGAAFFNDSNLKITYLNNERWQIER